MATTRSDGRKTRKEVEEEEELNRIMRRRENEERRKAADRAVARAEILVTSQGYSAAKFGKDRGRVQDIIQQAAEAEPTTEAGRRKQEKVLGRAPQFLRDVDEFSGKPVGNYEPVKPAWKRREEEAEKRKAEAKKAADEKFDEVKNTPGAQVFDWRDVDGAPGSRREVRGLGDSKDEELVQIEAPSGGFITARGKGLTDNLSKAEVRAREEMARAQKFQETLANNRRERAMNRLTDSGYDWKSEDSAALFNPDGTLNTAKAKRAADLAQGQKVRATFQSWDADKELERRAVAMQKDARSEERYLRQAQRGAYGLMAQRESQSPEGRARITQLQNNLAAGESNRGGLEPGFWRQEAEKVDAAGTERRAAVMNLEKADQAKVKSLMENSTNLVEAMARLYKDFEEGKITKEQMDAMSAYMESNYSGDT